MIDFIYDARSVFYHLYEAVRGAGEVSFLIREWNMDKFHLWSVNGARRISILSDELEITRVNRNIYQWGLDWTVLAVNASYYVSDGVDTSIPLDDLHDGLLIIQKQERNAR